MPAKKKASARETLAWVSKALALTVHELADKKEQLAAAEALLKSGQETMREHTKVVVELSEKLVAEERECEFWIDEAERFRNQVVELLRERAVNRKPTPAGPPPEPAGPPPSDDVKEIEALQDLALRGGVA